jgi:hypothetical protein
MSIQSQFVLVSCVKNEIKIEKKFSLANKVNVIPGSVVSPFVFTVSGKSVVSLSFSHGFQTLVRSGSVCPNRIEAETWNVGCPEDFLIKDQAMLSLINWFAYAVGLFSDVPKYTDCMFDSAVGVRLMSGMDECNYSIVSADLMHCLTDFICSMKSVGGWHNGELYPNTRFEHADGSFVVADSFIDIGVDVIPVVNPEELFDEPIAEISVIVKEDSDLVGLSDKISEEEEFDGSIPDKGYSSMVVLDALSNTLKCVELHSYVDVVHYLNNCHSEILEDILNKETKCTIVEHDNSFEFVLCGKHMTHYKVFGNISTFSKYMMILSLIVGMDFKSYRRSAYVAGDLQYGYYLVYECWKRRFDDHISSIPLRRSKGFISLDYCGNMDVALHRTSSSSINERNPISVFQRNRCYYVTSKRDRSKSYKVWAPYYDIPKWEMVDLASYKEPALWQNHGEYEAIMCPKYVKKRNNVHGSLDIYNLFSYPEQCKRFFDSIKDKVCYNHDYIKIWKSRIPDPDLGAFYRAYGYMWEDPYLYLDFCGYDCPYMDEPDESDYYDEFRQADDYDSDYERELVRGEDY